MSSGFRTRPPSQRIRHTVGEHLTGRAMLRSLISLRALTAGIGLIALTVDLVRLPTGDGGLSVDGRITLAVFVVAVWAWIFTKVDDTYVALGAAVALVLTGVLSTDGLFATLGSDTVWLLVAAFVIAAGVTGSGLATRATAFLVAPARTPRQLVHLLTGTLVVTTFAIPSTSGRAALALPIFLCLARALGDRPRLVRTLALLFPTVVLLSAVGSLLGAGAHLVTSEVLATATGEGISFVRWLLLGLPLALVASHTAAELLLALFTRRDDRQAPVRLSADDFSGDPSTPVTGPLSVAESRAALLLVAVVVLWCTEPLHGIDPAIIALFGALVATSPRYGSVSLSRGIKEAPWSLLLFLAATLALGSALTGSGAAAWLAGNLLGDIGGPGAAIPFLVVVVLVSTTAHLVIQSRSARSRASMRPPSHRFRRS